MELTLTHVIDIFTVNLLPVLKKKCDPCVIHRHVAHLDLLHLAMVGGFSILLVKQALVRMNSSEGLYFFSKTFFHVLAGFYDRKVNFDYLNFMVIYIETYDMTQLINLFFTTKRSFPSCDFALFIPVLLISQNNINAKVYFFSRDKCSEFMCPILSCKDV